VQVRQGGGKNHVQYVTDGVCAVYHCLRVMFQCVQDAAASVQGGRAGGVRDNMTQGRERSAMGAAKQFRQGGQNSRAQDLNQTQSRNAQTTRAQGVGL
jgi:hypothetical protein